VLVDVAPTAEAVVAGRIAAATVLVVDVLRASTTIITALDQGCAAIVPVVDAEEARRRRRNPALAGALMAGERRGEPLDGFDLGNSPLEFTADRVRGRTLLFTTSNGTRALLAARDAAAVGVAAFVNAGAAAAWAAGHGRDVTVICAGDGGTVSLEDHACAGVLVARVQAAVPTATLTEGARAACGLGRRYAAHVAQLGRDSSWARRLCEAGRGPDVAACLVLDTTTLVPVYLSDVDKVVSGPR
jgi:2-phosphosulfolactate phosphatase